MLNGFEFEDHCTQNYDCDQICKRVLYMHPIFQFEGYVTQLVFDLQLCNFIARLSYHCNYTTKNFSLIAHSQMKLCLFKVTKSDVCIRPFLQIQSQL